MTWINEEDGRVNGGLKARWRVAIVEDHLLQRNRTEELVTRGEDFDIVFSGSSAPEFVTWVRAAPPGQWPHLLLLDLMVDRAPSVDVELVKALLKTGLRIVVISALASPPLTRSIIRAGVTGVVGKRDSEEDIVKAIRAVLRGEDWMTSEVASLIAGDPDRPALSIQEERALVLYASGLTLEQVATAMNVGRETAKQYLDRVKKKYASAGFMVRSKLDFGRIAWSDGYLDATPRRAP
ncbi:MULTISPECIES: response regulator transcription factor [Arthrobacter]|uniref:Response regulator transcription factor n=2 Tax=Arthrobacter TaxID=1663 RepID=A0ABU9KI11_9MICC|nr:response regulator transcription factor [Arthrobacter sp. YJM1]MDP5226572.1 response regulator transcription factor [Arthrobacter sp. YJM1]